MFGGDYYTTSSKVESIDRSSFDVVFWLLIALVILMILAILALFFYCCCVKSAEGRDIPELKNKVVPEETIIHYKDGNVQAQNNNSNVRRPESRTRSTWVETQQSQVSAPQKNHVRADEERPSPQHRAAAVHLNDPITTSYAQNTEDGAVRGAYYPDGGIPVVAGGRMERAYRRGRPLSPGTEMLVQEMGGESDARRLGNYVVVRKVVRPRVRVDPAEDTQEGENGPRRTEILYIRSPMREEEEERHYVREGELLRSVSETALNADDLHLRVPRTYRTRGVPLQRMEDPAQTQQLKFSRYHRTEGDVIVATDEVPEMDRSYVGPDTSWGPVYGQPGEYVRIPRQRDERWDTHPEYQPQRLQGVEDPRARFPPHPNQVHGYMNQSRIQPGSMQDMQPQPVYREQYPAQDNTHRQYVPLDQPPLQRTLPPQPTFEPQRVPDQTRQLPDWSRPTNVETDQTRQHPDWSRPTNAETDHARPNDPDDDSRTVIMAPDRSRLKELTQNESQDELYQQEPEQFTASFENHPEEQLEDNTVRFQDDHEEATEARADSVGEGDGLEERPQSVAQPSEDQYQRRQSINPSEDQYQRRQSIRPSTQRLSTDDSGAISGRDKLGLDDTDVMDSRETHEESDRLGPRTTEDEVSKAEDQNQQTDGEDEDSDSGIGKDGTALRLKKSNLMEKKSLFTIAYDGMQTRGLKSAGERDDSP